MSGFRLTAPALRDVAEIITYHHRNSLPNVAGDLESLLFRAFNNLASSPAMGHKRSDLTDRNVLFHYERPYCIVFRRTERGTQILRVVHEARDLRKLI